MKILSRQEKRKIEEELESFGISKLPYLLIETGREKIRGYSGSLSIQEINKLARETRLEIIGIYLFKQDNGIRLSLDACHLLKPNKKIIQLDDEKAKLWVKGNDLILTTDLKGFVIIKHKDNFLGSGKAAEGKILNYIPKERRIR